MTPRDMYVSQIVQDKEYGSICIIMFVLFEVRHQHFSKSSCIEAHSRSLA